MQFLVSDFSGIVGLTYSHGIVDQGFGWLAHVRDVYHVHDESAWSAPLGWASAPPPPPRSGELWGAFGEAKEQMKQRGSRSGSGPLWDRRLWRGSGRGIGVGTLSSCMQLLFQFGIDMLGRLLCCVCI